MIVFPLLRLVGLKAATASSRVETLPMFVRSRPSRTRRTIHPVGHDRTRQRSRPPNRRRAAPRAARRNKHPCSSSSNQACGPLPDVAADDIEHQIDCADIFEDVVLEVDELLRAEVEHRLTVGAASGADHVGAELTCELRHHRSDRAGRAVRDHALPRLKAAVLEQSLPRGQARDRQARAYREVDVARQRREVACLDGRVLRQSAVAIPVREENTRCPTDSPIVP